MKHLERDARGPAGQSPPALGAWIETTKSWRRKRKRCVSPPAWGVDLKQSVLAALSFFPEYEYTIRVAQAQQEAGLERLAVSEQTLRHRLHAHGLLASIDAGRQTLLVRKTLAGYPRHALHLKADDLLAAIAETGAKLTP